MSIEKNSKDKIFWGITIVALIFGLIGLFDRMTNGHLHTNYGSYVPWGLWVAGYIYLIGLSAGVVCYFATHYIKRKLKIDDSLDVFPVHGVGGILGMMAVGVFAFTAGGINEPTDSETGVASLIIDQLGIQAIGVVTTIIWCGLITWLILKVVDMMVGVRVSPEEEQEGLDITMHEEKGYNL